MGNLNADNDRPYILKYNGRPFAIIDVMIGKRQFSYQTTGSHLRAKNKLQF